MPLKSRVVASVKKYLAERPGCGCASGPHSLPISEASNRFIQITSPNSQSAFCATHAAGKRKFLV